MFFVASGIVLTTSFIFRQSSAALLPRRTLVRLFSPVSRRWVVLVCQWDHAFCHGCDAPACPLSRSALVSRVLVILLSLVVPSRRSLLVAIAFVGTRGGDVHVNSLLSALELFPSTTPLLRSGFWGDTHHISVPSLESRQSFLVS